MVKPRKEYIIIITVQDYRVTQVTFEGASTKRWVLITLQAPPNRRTQCIVISTMHKRREFYHWFLTTLTFYILEMKSSPLYSALRLWTDCRVNWWQSGRASLWVQIGAGAERGSRCAGIPRQARTFAFSTLTLRNRASGELIGLAVALGELDEYHRHETRLL